MTAALGALAAILGFCAWALIRIHEARLHREAVERRLSDITHGDVPAVPSGFHSVPLTKAVGGSTGSEKVVPNRNRVG